MKTALLFSFLALTTSLATLSGCAAQDDASAAQTGAVAGERTSPLEPVGTKAALLTVTEAGTASALGSPKKIAAALEAFAGDARELPGAPRCGPPRLRVLVADGDAQEVASVDVCGEDSAFLKIGTKWFETPFAETKLREVLTAKPAIGDLLATANFVKTTTAEGTSEPMPAKQIKKGFDADALPTAAPDRPVTRCPPLITYTFLKDEAEIASVYVPCGFEDDETAPAQVKAGGASVGWVKFDFAASIGAF